MEHNCLFSAICTLIGLLPKRVLMSFLLNEHFQIESLLWSVENNGKQAEKTSHFIRVASKTMLRQLLLMN